MHARTVEALRGQAADIAKSGRRFLRVPGWDLTRDPSTGISVWVFRDAWDQERAWVSYTLGMWHGTMKFGHASQVAWSCLKRCELMHEIEAFIT